MGQAIAPIYDTEADRIKEQLAIASALRKQGMSGDIGSGYQGGKVYIVGNPLGNIAASIGGALIGRNAREDQGAMEQRQGQERADFLAGMPTGTETVPQAGPTQDGEPLPDVERQMSPRALAQATQQWAANAPRGMEGVQNFALQQALTAPQRQAEQEYRATEARTLAEQRAAQAKELQAERLAAAAERAQDSNALRMALAQMATANRSSGGANADLDRQIKEMRLEQMRNPAPKPPDAATRKAIHEANIGAANIDRAIDLINERPSSLGTKYKVPGMEVIGQYTDPEGTSARAAVSNIGSLKLHDRSGAAVTIAEFPRLAPFIPGPGDKPEVAKKKLEGLKTEYQTIVNEWSSGVNTSVLGGRKGADSKPAGKTIVREVKLKDGRTGVEYSDGTRGYK